MKKSWLIIGALVALLGWREYYHAHQTANICAARVADAVQVAIDETLSQF